MINESMLLKKSNYDKIVDDIGTESEFGKTIAEYVITDVIKVRTMLLTSFDFIVKNKQQQTSYNLLKDSFDSIYRFYDIFRNYRLTKYFNTKDVQEFLSDSSKVMNDIFDNHKFDDILLSSNKNVITCRLFFKNIFDMSVYDIFNNVFTSKKYNILNDIRKIFLFDVYDDNIKVYYDNEISLSYINENTVDLYYRIVNQHSHVNKLS